MPAMRRPELCCIGLSIAFSTALFACGGGPPSASKKLESAAAPLVVAPERVSAKNPASPFRKPSFEAPLPRSEPQVSEDRLTEILALAESEIATGNTHGAILELRKCANKVPASARCEGTLGQLLVDIPLRRAECRYYLAEAARADDALADAAFYGALGVALMGQGYYEDAATAYQRRIDRGAAQAADYESLATALQGLQGRQEDAAEALRRAFELDPTRIDDLHDEGVLRGQLPGQAKQAAKLLREFLARSADLGPRAVTLEARIAELEAVAEMEESGTKDGSPGAPT